MSSSQGLTDGMRARRFVPARDPGLGLAARTAGAALVAYVPVLVASWAHAPAGWAAAVVAALILASRPALFDAGTLACALVPTAALTLSGLVQPVSEYMAFATIGLAFVARCALDSRGRWRELLTARMPRAVPALVVAYLAWAAVATAFSTDRRTSLVYIAGMTFALGIAFWLVPPVLGTPAARRRLLVTVAAVALAAVAGSAVLAVTGPSRLFGVPYGSVLIVEPPIFGAPTHLVYPRAFGPYIGQGAYYTLVAAGLLAVLALRETVAGRSSALWAGAAAVLALALLLCFSRAGWTMAIAGGFVCTAASVWRRRPDWLAGTTTTVFGVALTALALNALGADARFDVQVARGWPAYVVADRLLSGDELLAYVLPSHGGRTGPVQQIRGGVSLTERDGLWRASAVAASHRPVLGYGPGTDAAAIAPFLGPQYADYRGISSHSGWLRTLVEMGGPGLLLVGAIWAGVLALGLTAVRRTPDLLRDVTFVVPVAWAVAFLLDETFQVYLFGGFGFYNLLTAVSLSLIAAVPILTRVVSPHRPARATTMMPSPQNGVVRYTSGNTSRDAARTRVRRSRAGSGAGCVGLPLRPARATRRPPGWNV